VSSDQPTEADVFNVAAAIDLFAADAAIEDALAPRPLPEDVQTVLDEIRAGGDPMKIAAADFMLDAYKLRLTDRGVL
jgi:hypothetical protein